MSDITTDDLTLTYDGNRLTGVSETAPDYDFAGSFEYKGARGSQYIYDSMGYSGRPLFIPHPVVERDVQIHAAWLLVPHSPFRLYVGQFVAFPVN